VTTETVTYASKYDADIDAEVLTRYGLRPVVLGPLASFTLDGRESMYWQVQVTYVSPAEQPPTKPLWDTEPDEHDMGRSTYWDEERESRD